MLRNVSLLVWKSLHISLMLQHPDSSLLAPLALEEHIIWAHLVPPVTSYHLFVLSVHSVQIAWALIMFEHDHRIGVGRFQRQLYQQNFCFYPKATAAKKTSVKTSIHVVEITLQFFAAAANLASVPLSSHPTV